MYKNKYYKYKLKYQNLKAMVESNLNDFSKSDSVKIQLLKRQNKTYSNPELCNGIVQFTKMCLELFNLYDPATTTYIFLGQSPIILNIISEVILQYQGEGAVFHYRGLPISGAGGLEYPTDEQLINVYNYFDQFNLNTITGNCIIIDYIDSGKSLAKIAELISKYIKEKGIEANIESALGLSSTGNQVTPGYFPITVLYLPAETIEERTGINLLAKKGSVLDTIRLYQKKELIDIINGNIEQDEAIKITKWLETNLNSLVITTISVLNGDTDICKEVPRITPTIIPKKSPIVIRMLQRKLAKGEISQLEYDEAIN